MKESYQKLKEIQDFLLAHSDFSYQRDIYSLINWKERMVGLIGERGVGKTTLMLQKLKENQGAGFYFSADNALITAQGLFNFVYYLYFDLKITSIYIDEIHKYSNRTTEIKNIYDSMPTLNVVFSGSSSLDLYKGILDLARRTSFRTLHPLNYKEYLKFFHQIDVPEFTLEEILHHHEKISLDYASIHKSSRFDDFLQRGQYPYTKDIPDQSYVLKFQNLFDKVILEDLPVFVNLQTASLDKLKRLLYFIANSTPSELSFLLLSKKIGTDRLIIENVLTLLHKIGIVSLIPKFGNLSDRVRKEYKMFLGNTNLYNAYNVQTDMGILRECFFVSQVKRIKNAELFSPKSGDFIVQLYDNSWHFEIGGKNKQQNTYDKQIFIVKDNIVLSADKRTIPLWLFGLLKT